MNNLAALSASLLLLASTGTVGVAGAEDKAPILKGEAAFGDWHADRPGVRRLIEASDLPRALGDTIGVKRSRQGGDARWREAGTAPRLLSRDGGPGGLKSPRVIRLAPNGDLFVADSRAHQVFVYRVRGGFLPSREKESTFATGLYQPYGIAFYPPGPDPQWVYIANSHSVVRFPLQER